MSTQITDPPATEDAQRRGHLAALAVAVQIVKRSPLLPTDVQTACRSFAPDEPCIRLYFHQSAAGVEQLARALGVEATTEPFRDGDPRPYVSMTATVDGIPVEAWTLLGDAEGAA
ncbi:hypothetical protein [Streptomyces noursei]|uniref:hypothetical protein n=1 Tax=Streptomyces noursei TaxID=1971 RepID=UPI0023B83FE4|nr:hypothetical protein [Streptomyces noursei]